MASTLIIYQGTGSQTDFAIPFDYLKKSFVTVSLQGTPLTGGDYGDTGADYYFLDKTKIRLKKAPASGQLLTVRRYTSQTQRVVSFKDASVLKATDLDASQLQAFHIAAEARDIINDALIQDKFDNWDAKNHRIVNLADPQDPQDAVTYKVYKQDAQGAYQSKLEAQKAKNTAKEWATKLGSKVNNEDYSSKYYAQQSSKSATASANSASSAKSSADTATTKASQAASSASTATTKASQASASASKAKTSETNAKTSETNAKSSETKAKTSETNAKASETKAKASQDQATRQAQLAKEYANQAADGQIKADWAETDTTSKAFIKNKPTLGALASKDSIAYSEITGTPPEQDLSGLATKNELQTGLAGKANKAHTHTVSQITDMPKVVLSVNDITPDDSGNVKVGALPLGHLFAWPFQTPPDGTIQCNGATYNRALYKDFFAYAASKGWVKTESEWQSIASTNGGYCSYYSDGDGSTTFRTPKFAPFMQIAIASNSVGNYHKAGVPNITGTVTTWSYASEAWTNPSTNFGAFFANSSAPIKNYGQSNPTGNRSYGISFDASRESDVYGNSSTVQPESNEWMICVVVAGQATNLGSVDVSNVMSAVAQVQADVSAIPTPKAYVTETWKSTDGTSWYHKWSNGFIEQGGTLTVVGTSTVKTFYKPFSSAPSVSLTRVSNRNYSSFDSEIFPIAVTASNFTYHIIIDAVTSLSWYAFGY